MKITVTLDLDVDEDAWSDVYGTAHVDKDVKNYVVRLVADSSAAEGCIREVWQR